MNQMHVSHLTCDVCKQKAPFDGCMFYRASTVETINWMQEVYGTAVLVECMQCCFKRIGFKPLHKVNA